MCESERVLSSFSVFSRLFSHRQSDVLAGVNERVDGVDSVRVIVGALDLERDYCKLEDTVDLIDLFGK